MQFPIHEPHAMTLPRIAVVAVLLASVAACEANDGGASASFNASATTDYRYRGLSQSRLEPALQGGVDVVAGGLYAGVWASTIRWIEDAGGDANVEMDVYGGYRTEVSYGLALDAGLLHYRYPSHRLATSPDTTELYLSLGKGPVTVKYSHAVGNLFGFAESRNSGYLDVSGTVDLGSGWTLTPHVGHQRVAGNGLYSYSDLSLALAKAMGPWSLGAALVTADTRRIGGVSVYASPTGRDLGAAGVVLSARYSQ
jgi:uncharacterized protein (TIGR02001 family)